MFSANPLRIVRTYDEHDSTTGEGTRYVAHDGSVWKRISNAEAQFNQSMTAPPAIRQMKGDYLL